jgi:hypothetical protein
MPEITALDYVLLPFYLWLIFKGAFYFRNKYYPEGHECRPYFIPGLAAKVAGAIFIGMIYNYYYGGGDTFNYFFHSQIINSTFTEDPAAWLRLITHNADETNLIDAQAVSEMYWYDDAGTYTTSCLGAFFGMFCLTKYLVINAMTATLSFVGMWLFFITYVLQYKHLTKYIAIAVLFMPSTVVWGSGLFKDSFCMFAIGCLVYCMYMLLEIRTFKIWLLLLALLSIILLVLVKAYILVVLFPALIIKVVLVYKQKLHQCPERRFAFYMYLALLAVCSIITLKRAAGFLTTFSAENVIETVVKQKEYLLRISIQTDGAAYDLGDFDPTPAGFAKKIGPAINVVLFRPYLWESRSVMQIFNAFESAAVLLLTLYLLFTRNIIRTLKAIYKSPDLIMCLFFTLIFAFFVGISSYNFGTLSRYKIPCTPFYMLFLIILLFKDRKDEDGAITQGDITKENIAMD